MSNLNNSGSNGANHNNNSSSSNGKDRIWYFSAEELANSPSRRCGIKADQELSYRQLTAYLIQEMGQRLQVSQLCINTAIVYMHRFYAFHSFTQFHRNSVAAASLFLAAKVEEQPRKLEHVIKAANKCLPQNGEVNYAEQAQDLVFNENVLLQTLGFDVAIDHPHTHVVKTCHLVKACKDLAQTSYFLASNSLHLTSMCLQYRPTVVACFCIYLACKWSRWEIPQSTEGKHWFYYVDKSVTLDLLKQLTDEFISIYEKSPTRLQSKLNSIKAIAQGASNRGSKDKSKEDFKMGDIMKGYHSSINTSDSNSNGAYSSGNETGQQTPSSALLPPPAQPPLQQQMRKSDMHSSQHRTHHSSSSVSSLHHHGKPPYPGSGESLADHKSKQQGAYGSSSMNRPISNHQSMSSSSAQRGNVPSGSGRPSSSNSLSSQRPPPPQMHPMDYHKSSRDRNGMNMLPGAHNLPPPPHASHKIPPKQESGSSSRSSSSKDPMGRLLPEQQSKQSSSKLYPTGPPPYGSNQLPPTQSGKIDDPARAMLHGQRGYMPSSSAGGVGQASGGGYHHHRSSGIASSSAAGSSNTLSGSSNISSKSSVHGLPHAPYDQLPPPYGSSSSNSQNHQQSYGTMRSSSDMSTGQLDEHSSLAHGHPPIHPLLAQSKASSASGASLFSPDWKDKQHLKANTSHDSLSYKLGGSNRDKNSPKKDRNSNTSTPTKKDKSRMLSSSSSSSASASMTSNTVLNAGGLASLRNEQHLKSSSGLPRKSETLSGALTGLNELAGTSHGVPSGTKRSNEISGYAKHEEDLLQRDNKIRKMESGATGASSAMGGLPTFAFPGSSTNSTSLTDSTETKHPISMTNGMETTPDLVRSLLKESLCTTSGLIKTEPLTLPGLKPPAELLDPSAGQQTSISFSSSNNNNSTININNSSSTSNPDISTDAQNVEHSLSNADDSKLEGSKSEKKKKKDKHKHKEKDKDKSKDREERKKHKKDKDKHKDRDREGDSLEHVKLVIPKEKLESVSGGSGISGDLKLKIAKDRFKADNGQVPLHLGPSGLKIKISKDILETYSTGASNFVTSVAADPMLHGGQMQSLQASGGSHMQLGAMPHGMGGGSMNNLGALSAYGLSTQGIGGIGGGVGGGSNSSGGSRRKDRDRDKDKEKKRSHDFLKYNGNANLLQSGLAPSTSAPLLPMSNATSLATATPAAMSSLASSYAKK